MLLEEAKSAKAEAAAIRAALGGMDATQVAQILSSHKQAEEDRAKKAGEFDKVLQARIVEAVTPLQRELEEARTYREKFNDRELDLAIRAAATKAGVLGDDVDTVVDIMKHRRIKLDAETGKPTVVDKDGYALGISIEKFFAETYKAEKPKFYEFSGGQGGGARPGSGSTRGSNNVSITDTAGFLANVDRIAKGEMKVVS